MSYCLSDTIYALSSGAGRGGVAVIRVSGPKVREILKQMASLPEPTPRYAYFRALKNHSGAVLDHALVLYFAAPASFTGEDVAELQVHGGFAVIKSVLEALGDYAGCRPAQRGEFSRRAVLSGKIDLTQAEGILDLIHAETAHQREAALEQTSGVLKEKYEAWRHLLVRHRAYLEAFIDFPEEDLPPEKARLIDEDVRRLSDDIARHLNDNHAGEKLKEGFQITLLGVPNVGKSSLINMLAKKDVAIVSQIAGTTRDIVQAYLDADGFPVILSDTAGLREQADVIETEGIRRALEKAAEADLILHVADARDYPNEPELPHDLNGVERLVVWNKADLAEAGGEGIFVSARTGQGSDALWEKIRSRMQETFAGLNGGVITRERYRTALKETQSALTRALAEEELELKAEELRLAAQALGRITGVIHTEELLDVIFKDFCIGK